MKTVLIVIPCRNEENYISKCLYSIINCNYPKDFLKVIVCDGMSDDNTVSIIETIRKEHPFIQVIQNKRKTTQYALNLGLKAEKADLKIILGAHAEIDKEFINENLNVHQKEDVYCTGGVLENVIEDSKTGIIAKAMASSFGVGNAYFRTGTGEGYVDTVAFGAYKSEVFERVGYFDEDLVRNQDDEFNFRLIKNGLKIFLSPSIKAKYYVRSSFKKLFRQYSQYGYWKVFVNKKHGVITTVRQLVPPLFVLFVLIGFLMSFLNKWMMLLYLLGWGLYVLAALYSAFQKEKNFVAILKISFVFAILHFSYGLGYLSGILDFYLLNKKPKNAASALSR